MHGFPDRSGGGGCWKTISQRLRLPHVRQSASATMSARASHIHEGRRSRPNGAARAARQAAAAAISRCRTGGALRGARRRRFRAACKRASHAAAAKRCCRRCDSAGAVLIAGLGSRIDHAGRGRPADSADHVIATRHLVAPLARGVRGSWRPVCALAPGVLGQTGVETGEVVWGVLDRVRPRAAVIAVDALAAGRLSRGWCARCSWRTPALRPGARAWDNARAALDEADARRAGARPSACRRWRTAATLAHEIAQPARRQHCLRGAGRPVPAGDDHHTRHRPRGRGHRPA